MITPPILCTKSVKKSIKILMLMKELMLDTDIQIDNNRIEESIPLNFSVYFEDARHVAIPF
ncbi:hypothetical protein BpHYR1_021468 [Brachionus plicatilis]|uniref:Uncharacterized protein n=1 Tax=Brachionus plicatilis TaxID=10195 RepID=A0A3M7S0E8_BRAPC|nr:hypothetical protein BpHYR1_021468 [Brachionus plicatilis]